MMNEAVADLAWLAERGALAGVAEIIRERRRQVEQLGWTPEYDRAKYADGWLMRHAAGEAQYAILTANDGRLDASREYMARCGNAAAAEIDRLAAGSGG